jgi:hypothetical protein
LADCAIELDINRITLQHAAQLVEINEGITHDNNIHFADVKSSPGNQMFNTD